MKKVIFGILIGLSLSTISVIALSLCNAKDIEYNASDTKWDVDTVEDALNDLYKSDNDSCHNVAKPNLGTNNKLIPVIISDNGTITKVSKNNPGWYNYCEKKWANAVILNDGVSVPSDNSTISMSNIESMFVWIPKYKYRLWNVNVDNPLYSIHSIDIVFDTTNTTEKNGESCVTPKTSGAIGNCANGEYMTHPAFLAFGGNGFWVGKFETGHKNATNATQAQVSSNSSNLIVVKPNVYSWRNNTVRNTFEAAKGYESTLNSHMMKNTEWGAVAYLTHSRYGIDREVTINNNSAYKTGYAALPSTDQIQVPGDKGDGAKYNTTWNTENGYRASTTGNITGIYDMSGGAWEYVAAYKPESEKEASGFSKAELNALDSRYVDVYDKTSTINSYTNMILGDATGELGPFSYYQDGDGVSRWHNRWYADCSNFIDASVPWFNRGGVYYYGVLGGQFVIGRYTGAAFVDSGFRLVLAPSN